MVPTAEHRVQMAEVCRFFATAQELGRRFRVKNVTAIMLGLISPGGYEFCVRD